MFDQIFDSMRKAAETNVQMQQEMFKRWAALWPVPPGAAPFNWNEKAQGFQKKWTETVVELAAKQRETQKEQFALGMKYIEEAFKVAEVKDVNVLRAKTLELWQKTFELLQQSSDVQIRDFRAAVAKWSDMFTQAA